MLPSPKPLRRSPLRFNNRIEKKLSSIRVVDERAPRAAGHDAPR
jgi:hypothetical protein